MSPFASVRRRSVAEEQMDAADLPAARYDRVLADLARVNRMTLAARPTLAFLDRLRAEGAGSANHPWRILDVGFGNGDMLRAIHRWAERHRQPVVLVGIDCNPNSLSSAQTATPATMRVDYRIGDYAALAGQGWDIVLSSLVAHHMDDGERLAFLRFMAGEARLGWLVNDLHRHRFAYLGFPLLARLLRVDPIVRTDGQLSIARSFRQDDWMQMLREAGLAGSARIVRRFPFRLCVEAPCPRLTR